MNKDYKNFICNTKTPPSDNWIPLYTTPQTKPLSDEEIMECYENRNQYASPDHLLNFARAIEERHGIK